MTEERSIVTASEIQVLLNALSDRGERLIVEYPFYGVPLFAYDPRKGAVVTAVKDTEFDDARIKRLPGPKRLQDDLPTWSDIRDALLTSGVIPYANSAEVAETLKREGENARNASNPNPTFLAFDTNTLYHRVPSRSLPRLIARGGFQFAVSDAVQGELDAAMDQKYGDQDIQALRAKLAENRRVGELTNRPVKKGRRAKLALSDIRRLEKLHRSVRCPADPLTNDKEKNDRTIAKSYADLAHSARADLLLLTSDDAMKDHALTARVKALFLQIPPPAPIPLGPMDERMLCRLIHDLAVSFGALRFAGLATTAWGDWSGKRPEESESESLRLDHPAQGVLATVRQDVETARRLEMLTTSVR